MTSERDAETPSPALELLEVAFDPPAPPIDPQPHPSHRWRALTLITAAVALIAAVLAFLSWRWEPRRIDAPHPADAAVARNAPPGVMGFAELYLTTYLTATGSDRIGQLEAFYPGAPGPVGAAPTRFVRQAATLDVDAAGADSWVLHVAVDVLVHDGVGYQPDGIHHYLVGVIDSPHGFAATSLPVRIATPPPAPIAAVEIGVAVDDPGITALVEGFLAAYLLGEGDVRTFTTIDSAIVAVDPPPYQSLALDTIVGLEAEDESLQVRVIATATDDHGETPVELSLAIRAQSGAWLIQRLIVVPVHE